MLTEYTTPGASVEVRDDESIYSLLTERIKRTGEDTVIAKRKTAPGQWTKVTTGEFHKNVLSAAKGLIAFGIGKGDAVTLFSTTRYEWGVLDFALAAIGAVNVPIYDTDSAAQAERILNDSNVKLAIADDRERFDRLDSVIGRCPSLKHILMLDANAMGALEGLGVTVSDEELDERIASVRADDLATIVYTSGSTGAPKGAELSHRNFVSITRAGSLALHEMILEDHPRLLLFLPLAHCFARFIQYASIASDDGVVGYLPDTKTLLPDVRSFEPTYLLGVPRVFEKVYNAASRKAGMGWKGRLFLKAAESARDWSRMQQAGEKPTMKQTAEHLSYEASVYHTVRGALGPRIRYVACGGAPLDVSLAHFFNGIGLPMIQGYGMTETAAPFAATRVTDNVIGTVGQPAPGSSVRISDDGELQVKGPNVFMGYHNLPEKTAEVFTEDGWLRTGDLASIEMRVVLRLRAARRTSSSPPAARTCRRFRWSRRLRSVRLWSMPWWWAIIVRSSARWSRSIRKDWRPGCRPWACPRIRRLTAWRLPPPFMTRFRSMWTRRTRRFRAPNPCVSSWCWMRSSRRRTSA